MIYVGIDDTDVPGMPGTKQFARALAAQLADHYLCARVVRHQLLEDPRVPCTTKNSAASLLFLARDGARLESLIDRLRDALCTRQAPGSDPGLCVAPVVPAAIMQFGRRCQRELVTQEEARRLAQQYGLYLEALGGTGDGVIGALAAVGLAAEGDDGRVVQLGQWPDDLAGPQDLETLHARGVEVRCLDTGDRVTSGTVDVGKRLRPNVRAHRVVLFARRAPAAPSGSLCWQGVRLP